MKAWLWWLVWFICYMIGSSVIVFLHNGPNWAGAIGGWVFAFGIMSRHEIR